MKIFNYMVWFLFITFLSLFEGCMDKNLIQDNDIIDLENEVEVTIQYAVPGMSGLLTKAEVLTKENQNKVETVSVIVYKVENDEEIFAYHRNIFDLEDYRGTGSFKVRIAKSHAGEKYTFDFLFNVASNEMIQQLSKMTIGETTREEVQQGFTRSGSLSVASGSTLPMWGTFVEPQVITNTTVFPVLHPIRSLASIDIGLNMDENDNARGLDNFTLKGGSITYYPTYFYYIPHKQNVDFINHKVTAPTGGMKGVQHHTRPINDGSDCILGSLFIGDIDVQGNSNANQPNAVIISGSYKDSPSVVRYFRIDLLDPTDPTKKLNILRNHRYRINILSIEGEGYTSIVNACQNPASMSIIYEMSVFGQGDINHMVYNGSGYLGVSQLQCEVTGTPGTTQDVEVLTNIPAGWRVTLTDENGGNPDWITASPASLATTSKTTVTFTLTKANTGQPRMAYATFTAGSLSITVQILQNGVWYISSNYQNGTMMLGDGQDFEIYAWGDVPANLIVRAYTPDHDLEVSWERITLSSGTYTQTAPSKQDLALIGNAIIPNKIRQVQFQYTLNNGTTWISFEEGPQGKGHYRLKSTNRIVALYDFESTEDDRLIWTEAMGVDSHWRNNHLFRGEGKTNYPYKLVDTNCYYYIPDASTPTGCVAYVEKGYEDKYPTGKWRLPSQAEVEEMTLFYQHIGDLAEEGMYYWTSTEQIFSHAGAHAVRIVYGSQVGTDAPDKDNYQHPVRCVYGDPDPALIDPPTWWPAD